MKKKKTNVPQEQARTMVYVGPNIPGVAKQFTSYTGGNLPKRLEEAVSADPVMAGLVIPLEDLPAAMEKLRGGYGHIYRLYRLAQAKL